MENIEEKLGQMIIVRMYGKTVSDELIDIIRNYKVGGIILRIKNYSTNFIISYWYY